MTGAPQRYHPLYALGFLRRAALVCLLPPAQALLRGQWAELTEAVWQSLGLAVLLTAASLVILWAGSWRLTADGQLVLGWVLFSRQRRTIRGSDLAAVQIERPILCRLTGASLLTLYPTTLDQRHKVQLCLSRRSAEALADALLPVPVEQSYHPRGGERMALAVLGAGGLSTLLLALLSLRQSRNYLPVSPGLAPLDQAAALAARWLPAGLAWFVTLAAFLFGLSLLRSFSHTVRYAVWQGGGALASRGGLLRRTERRLRLSALSCAEVRLTPLARLLRCYPVYLTAGCLRGEDAPLFVYRAGQEELLRRLVPGLHLPPVGTVPIKGRSLAFFLPSGIAFGLLGLMTLVSRWALPALTAPLALLTLAALGGLVSAAEGYLREGAWPRSGRLTLLCQRGYSLRCFCIFASAPVLTVRQSPWAVAAGRADLLLNFPGRVRLRVRSLPVPDGMACAAFLEQPPGPERTDPV